MRGQVSEFRGWVANLKGVLKEYVHRSEIEYVDPCNILRAVASLWRVSQSAWAKGAGCSFGKG
jgi:hypothetical protein